MNRLLHPHSSSAAGPAPERGYPLFPIRNFHHASDESQRLAALRALKVLDTPPVEELDRITRLASRLFDVPIALVSLVDAHREWFKSRVGLDLTELDRAISFCTHTIRTPGLMVVEDARKDTRFQRSPAVVHEPHIVFYAGHSIYSRTGHALGTLCVIDRQPRSFSPADARALRDLAGIVQEYFHQLEIATHAQALGQDSRLMEVALRESERRYTALFNNKTSGICHLRMVLNAQGRPVNYYIEAVNETYERLMGVRKQDVEGKLATEAFPGLEKLDFDFLQPYADVAMDGREERFERYFSPTDQWFSVYAYSPARGECISIFSDVTEQKRVEIALRENEEALRATFEQAAVGIAHVDAKGYFLRANRRLCEILGYTEAELRRKTFIDLTHPLDREASLNRLHQAVTGQVSTFTAEKRYLHRDGSTIWARISVAAVRDPNSNVIKYNLTIIEDITERKRAEEELRRERAQLQAILDNAPLLISIRDVEGRLLLANRAVLDHIAVAGHGDVTGHNVSEIFPAPVAEQLRASDELALTSNAPLRVEEVLQHRDGSSHAYLTIKFPVRDAKDRPPFGICAISTDISERKRADEERERLVAELEATAINADRSRAQLEAVFESMQDGVAVFDMQGNMVMLNKALARMNRFASVNDMRQHLSYFARLYEFSQPDGKRVPLEQWPATRVLRGESFTEWELQGRRLDIGQSWYFSYSGAPVHDESGRQVLAVVVMRDISARKRLERELQKAQRELERRVEERTAELRTANEALRQEKERTRTVLETATDAYVACDEQGLITDWNHAAERLFGWGRDEILGRPLASTLITCETLENHDLSFERLHQGSDVDVLNHVLELTAKNKDGHEFPVDVSLAANQFGDSWTISIFLRDISERKQAEAALRQAHDELAQSLAAEQAAARAAETAKQRAEEAMLAAEAANRAKSEFLATMSHEIRTPLNGVIGFNGLLLDGPLNEEKRHYAELARQSGEALLHLLNDFLDFSKIEAGHLELEPMAFDPRQEVAHALGMVQEAAQKKRLQLTSSVNAPARVRGDAARLRQILLNLLSNAVKFTEQGRVSLNCHELMRQDGVSWLCFRVSDTGIGIDPSARERLFQPFSQADASTTRRFGGTGLGLAICKRLAAAMGGKIGVQSIPAQGSTFWVELPFELLAAEDAAEPEKLPEASAPAAEERTRGRVLVVEDNPVSQLMAAEMLKRLGCRVDVVGNGLEAVEAMRRLPYDLVLMDCDMPVMNGFDATRIIRREEGEGRRVPIVAITASALKGDSERCMAVGMDDFMSKPIRLQDMSRMVETWLNKSGEPS